MAEIKKQRISQSDTPLYSFEEVLPISKAIVDDFAGDATSPLQVAMSLDVGPQSRFFRDKCGASIAYCLTKGGYNSDKIEITDLSKKIHSPTEEGMDLVGVVEAIMKPKIHNLFFAKYNKSKFPADKIALNVLSEMGVPKDKTEITLNIIKANANYAGIIKEAKTGNFIFIDQPIKKDTIEEINVDKEDLVMDAKDDNNSIPLELLKKLDFQKRENQSGISEKDKKDSKPKVFISHGKNRKIVEQLKEILKFGQFEPVVSVEKETTAIPVPEKVFSDMRQCDFGVIHIEGEQDLLDAKGNSIKKINDNVLIEIGAAIALFDKKFILLCENTVVLPSNLQGLYRCNYEGNELNYDATIKLLKTFNEFR